MIIEHFDFDTLTHFFSKQVGDLISETIVAVDIILNEYEVLRIANVFFKTLKFWVSVGEDFDTVVSVEMCMAEIMCKFDFSDLLSIKLSSLKRMLFWPWTLEEFPSYFSAYHCLSFKTTAKEKIEDHTNYGKEKESESPRDGSYRIFIFRHHNDDAGYNYDEVENYKGESDPVNQSEWYLKQTNKLALK